MFEILVFLTGSRQVHTMKQGAIFCYLLLSEWVREVSQMDTRSYDIGTRKNPDYFRVHIKVTLELCTSR